MSDVKTLYFPDAGSTKGNELLGLAAMNGGMGGGMWNNPIWALVFLAFLGRNGIWGNNGQGDSSQLAQIQAQLNSNQGQTLLMDAIKGNAGAIHELAAAIGCNQNAVIAAINGVQSAICNVGNQVGYNAMQTINAINSGNASLASQLSSCCCDIRESVTKMGYDNQIATLQQTNALDRSIGGVNATVTKGFCDTAYATQQQTCALAQNNDANTRSILAKLDSMEDSRKDREIAALTAQLTASNARAERQAELQPIYKALSDVQCKMPSTVTTAYSPFVPIPNCVAAQYGLYGGLTPYAVGQGGGFL